MYDIYAHKQPQRAAAESPNPNLGITRPSPIENGISVKQAIGIGNVTRTLAPATKSIFNTVVASSGDSRLKRNVARIDKGLGFGLTALTLGLPAAVVVEGISFAVEGVQLEIQEGIDQTNQNYKVQKVGAKIQSFNTSGGDYYD